MNRDVFWTAEARHDIASIVRRIAADDPEAADRVAAAIFEAGRLVGSGVPGRPGRIAGLREKVVRSLPYILAYEVASGPDGEERIVILHVIHAARNWLPQSWPPP